MRAPHDLRSGYALFRNQHCAVEAERYRQLGEGQSPRTIIIGCADSRVDLATIFSARPGELFVVRNVAAIVPPNGKTAGTMAHPPLSRLRSQGSKSITSLSSGMANAAALPRR